MSHHTTLGTALDSGMIPHSKCTVLSRASWKIKGAGREPKFSGKKMIQRGAPSRAVFLSYQHWFLEYLRFYLCIHGKLSPNTSAHTQSMVQIRYPPHHLSTVHLDSMYSLHLLRARYLTHRSTETGKKESPMASAHTAVGGIVKPS